MPPSANLDPALHRIEAELAELERICGEFERAIWERRWNDVQAFLAEQRRTRHALEIAIAAAKAVRNEKYDRSIFRRLGNIYAIRQQQLARLGEYRRRVGERLSLLSRWKDASKRLGKPPNQKKSRLLDRLQ
ncbi:MAG: hypothetical protein JOZ38_11580 [Candidatus Eremiobacteraeota bacterium]|nr:hypothetical protein [Candidatus Eremiobacteraeota bacterium]